MPPRHWQSFHLALAISAACARTTPDASAVAPRTAETSGSQTALDARSRLLALVPDRVDSVFATDVRSFVRGDIYRRVIASLSRDPAFVEAVERLRPCGLSLESIEAIVVARHTPSQELLGALYWPTAGKPASITCVADTFQMLDGKGPIDRTTGDGHVVLDDGSHLWGADSDTVLVARGEMIDALERCVAGECDRAIEGRFRELFESLPPDKDAWFATTGEWPEAKKDGRAFIEHVRGACDLVEDAEIQAWIVTASPAAADAMRTGINVAEVFGADPGWGGELREVTVSGHVVATTSTLPLGAIVDRQLAKLSLGAEAADMMDKWADRVCACRDLDCVRVVQSDQEAWIVANGIEVTGTPQQGDRIEAATKRMTQCLVDMMPKEP